MKFLCDHMLSRLGKWLRAAGHDTLIITTSISDREVLDIAIATDRILVTRDRHFLNMKAANQRLLYLKSNDFEACINELNQKIDIDWLYAPFTRCLICNSLLEHPSSENIEYVPPSIRQQERTLWYCPFCHQLYWEGSHTQRMRRQLEIWQIRPLMNAKNILITGRPRVGKSTFIKSCAQILASKAGGFFTEEVVGKGIRGRCGFRIVTLSGQTAILAEVDAESSYHVGRYGIFLDVLDEVAVPTIYEAIANSAKNWILIDEIGKMEEGSTSFKQALLAALNSPKRVLATIRWNDSPFTEMIKERSDVEIIKMTVPNREHLTEILHSELKRDCLGPSP